jgi:cellulose synthase (UDP-forming)
MFDSRRKRLFQLLMLAAVASNLFYLWYRVSFTINFNALAFSVIFLLAEVHGIISLFLFFFDLWGPKHQVESPSPKRACTVDVFIPTYNEDAELLHRTVLAARDMTYPHETYILDDGGREEVRALAERLGVHYISRPEHVHAKAGNINYALERTRGELVAIFDADHVPAPNFLERTLGYFNDDRMGFVQTPHVFYNTGSFQTFADYRQRMYWDDQLLFFRAVQPGKNRWGAAFFCGSCGVIRRKCLEEVGGFDFRTITEDMHTSLRIHAKGWKSVYHDEHLSTGLSPGDLGAYWKQRMRWAVGNLSTMWHDDPMFKKGLTLPQRISYFSSVWAWTVGPQKLVFYLSPVLMLMTGLYPIANFTWLLLAIYAGNLIFSLAVHKIVSRGYARILRGELFNMINGFMLTFAMIRAAFGLGTRKFVVTRKGGGSEGIGLYVLPQVALILVTYWGMIWAWLRFRNNMVLDATLTGVAGFWSVYNAGLALTAMRVAYRRIDVRDRHRFRQRLPVRYDITSSEGRRHTGLGVTLDFHSRALAFRASERLPVGESISMILYLPYGENIYFTGILPLRYWRNTVSTSETAQAGTMKAWDYVVEITDLPPREQERLDRFINRFVIPATFRFLSGRSPLLRRRFTRWFGDYAVRRAFPRHGVQLPVALQEKAHEEADIWHVTDDLSEGGLAVTLTTPGLEGSETGFTLLLPDGRIEGVAQVVREEPVRLFDREYYRYGLRFVGLRQEDRDRIHQLARYAIEAEVGRP